MTRVFFYLLVLAVFYNLYQRIVEDRRAERARRKLSREYAIIIGHVLAMSRMMHCWAENIGDPPEVLRPKLKEAARAPQYDVERMRDAFE